MGVWTIPAETQGGAAENCDHRIFCNNLTTIVYLHGQTGHRGTEYRVELYKVLRLVYMQRNFTELNKSLDPVTHQKDICQALVQVPSPQSSPAQSRSGPRPKSKVGIGLAGADTIIIQANAT